MARDSEFSSLLILPLYARISKDFNTVIFRSDDEFLIECPPRVLLEDTVDMFFSQTILQLFEIFSGLHLTAVLISLKILLSF